MKLKKPAVVFLLIVLAATFVGCQSSNVVNFSNISYLYCDNPSLGEGDVSKLLDKKLGTYEGSTVYSIKNEPKSDWIYLNTESMSDSPVGLFKAAEVKVQSLADFKPNKVTVYRIQTSKKDKFICDFADTARVDKLVSCIKKGRHVSSKVTDNIVISTEYQIVFKSDKFPSLTYTFDYEESRDGKYYVTYESFAAKVDSEIHRLISKR